MLSVDEEAVICDLAETYSIYDYRQLSPNVVAVFSVGLKDSSRIKMKLSGMSATAEVLLLAQIADALNTLVWFNSKDRTNQSKRPKSLVEAITNPNKTDEKPMSFSSGEEFEKYRFELMRKGGML